MHMKTAFAAGVLQALVHVLVILLVLVPAFSGALFAAEPVAVKIRDLTSIEGVRENPLIGYGMVVGLTRTGDSQQTAFTTQTLANIMQRMGAQIPAATARVNNVASVFVTASLPAFARPGMQVDVTVSSIGDAKSLEGGLLLLTPLYGADGQVYAAAQGPVAVGGFAAGGAGATKQLNHPTVGRVPAGGRVERSLAFDFNRMAPVSLHPAPCRNSSHGWMVQLLGRARASGGKPSHRDWALGGGIDLSIRAIERRQQKQAAFEALGIADRGDGYVHLRARPRECRQAGGHKHRCDIVDARRRRRNLRAHALHNVGQGLGRECGLLAVPSTGEPNYHAVPNQRIFPYPFDAGEIADFDRDRFGRKERSGKRGH